MYLAEKNSEYPLGQCMSLYFHAGCHHKNVFSEEFLFSE